MLIHESRVAITLTAFSWAVVLHFQAFVVVIYDADFVFLLFTLD